MKIEIIEYILIGFIIILQIGFFIYTLNKIIFYKNLIPISKSLSITKLFIPKYDLEYKTPSDILSEKESYKNYNSLTEQIIDEAFEDENLIEESYEETIIENSIRENVQVNIIECDSITNKIFDTILKSINTYLIRNRSSASDFNLMKDVVERNSDAVEEEINLTISTPLYLGLMGTMLGIVIGLFYMSDFSTTLSSDNTTKSHVVNDSIINNSNDGNVLKINDNVEGNNSKKKNSIGDGNSKINEIIGDNISILLGGVKIAMIASLFGLILIIINSSILFKISLKIIEQRKNEFYSFIQIELLPILNQGLGSTFESLQRNLLKFNDELSVNLNGLSGIFNSNKEALVAQQEILSKLENIPIAQIAKYNIKVLKELQNSTSNIEQFNNYLDNINSFVSNSNQLVNQSNDLLSRTDNFKDIADNLEYRLTESQKLMEFLSNHFEKLEEHKVYVNRSVADVGIAISEVFSDLKEHIQNSTKAVKDFTIDELEALKNALSESKTNLSNLEHLASIMKDVSDFKSNVNINNEEVKRNLLELNKNIKISTDLLDALESTTLTHKTKVFSNSVKNLFKKNEKK